MTLDWHQVALFFHVVLFAYWLGGDLGVFVSSRIARRATSDEAKTIARKIGHLVDMAPRSCAVLMVPVGLSLAATFGSPITGLALVILWIASLVWLWMVWTIFLQGSTPTGRKLWRIDLAIRVALMIGFIGFGISTWISGTPIAEHWLAAKYVVFGLILLDGIWLRLELVVLEHAARAAPAGTNPGERARRRLTFAVLLIWLLVAIAAFLGVTKPF